MKKTILISISLLLVTFLLSCGKQSELVQTAKNITEYYSEKESDKKDNAVSQLGGDTPFCNHVFGYHSIDAWLFDYANKINPEAEQNFILLFGRTEDCNRRFFMDYYGIPKEDYWNIYDKEFIIDNPNSFDINFYNPDIWFSDDYFKNPLFVQEGKVASEEGSVIIRPEDDTIHTDRYFTICGSLIDFVGEEKFNEFKAKYGGTENFNILNFIKEFNISKEDFKNCTETQLLVTYGVYNTDYIYGTEEMQKEYFEKHILTQK